MEYADCFNISPDIDGTFYLDSLNTNWPPKWDTLSSYKGIRKRL
jgi:hypothetical protein